MRLKWMLLAAALCIGAMAAGCQAKAAVDKAKPTITVSFTYAEGLRYSPSYAIWVQDEAGNRATLYATGKVAANNFGGAQRPGALPIWSGVQETDVATGATPGGKADIACNIPAALVGKKLTLYIEANASYDYNEYYKENLKQGEEGYNDVNGQPSVLWSAPIDPAQVRGEVKPAPIGAGDVLGADHEVHGLDHVTTASGLLTGIAVTYDYIK